MDKLLQLSNEMNIELTPEMLSAFDSYYHMLVEKNKVMNLTAITEKDEVILKHFVDSISVAAAGITGVCGCCRTNGRKR